MVSQVCICLTLLRHLLFLYYVYLLYSFCLLLLFYCIFCCFVLVRRHFDKEAFSQKKKTTSSAVDEAMEGLNLNTLESSDEELNEYLENVAETAKPNKSSSKHPKHQNRKKKTAKRKTKK